VKKSRRGIKLANNIICFKEKHIKQSVVSSIQSVVYTSKIINNLKTKFKEDQRKRNAHKQFILVHSYNKRYIQFPETTG